MNPLRKLGSVGRIASAHKLSVGIASLAVAAAGTGIGFGVSDAASSASPTTTTSVPAAGAKGTHHKHGIRGHLVSMSGNDWTLKTAKGKSYTIVVGPATKYGTAASALQESSFSDGDLVVVRGHRDGTTIDATRVAMAHTPASDSDGSGSSGSTGSAS